MFHVYARGNDKRRVYLDDIDRRAYLQMLRITVRQCRWRLLAYCLMDNHVHLLTETPQANLSAGMRWLQSSYAGAFNSRHGRSGHVFQGRFGSVRITTDEQFSGAVLYVALNPVAAGLCHRPEDWPWSSHGMVLAGTAPDWVDVPRLLGHLSDGPGSGMRRYAALFKGQTLHLVKGQTL